MATTTANINKSGSRPSSPRCPSARRPKLMRSAATAPSLVTSYASRNDLADRHSTSRATMLLTRYASHSATERGSLGRRSERGSPQENSILVEEQKHATSCGGECDSVKSRAVPDLPTLTQPQEHTSAFLALSALRRVRRTRRVEFVLHRRRTVEDQSRHHRAGDEWPRIKITQDNDSRPHLGSDGSRLLGRPRMPQSF
jgi:hypothetical protein